MSTWFGGRLDWAVNVIKQHAKQLPGEDSKECWKLRLANRELHAFQQHSTLAAKLSVYELATVNYSRHSRQGHRNALYNELADRQNYALAAGALRRLHPFLTSWIRDLTDNTYSARKYHKRINSGEEATQRAVQDREEARGIVCEMVLSQMQRLRSEHNAPFLIVLKSMVAFRQGLNFTYWKAGSALKGLMSYQWTHDFVVEMSKKPTELPFKAATSVGFVVYDNCDYHRKKAYDRTDDKSEYVKTVQMVQVPVNAALGELSADEIGARITPYARQQNFKKYNLFIFFCVCARQTPMAACY